MSQHRVYSVSEFISEAVRQIMGYSIDSVASFPLAFASFLRFI